MAPAKHHHAHHHHDHGVHKNDRKYHEEKHKRAAEAQQAALLSAAAKGDVEGVMQYIMNERNAQNHLLLHACLRFKNLTEAQFLTVLRWDERAAGQDTKIVDTTFSRVRHRFSAV